MGGRLHVIPEEVSAAGLMVPVPSVISPAKPFVDVARAEYMVGDRAMQRGPSRLGTGGQQFRIRRVLGCSGDVRVLDTTMSALPAACDLTACKRWGRGVVAVSRWGDGRFCDACTIGCGLPDEIQR